MSDARYECPTCGATMSDAPRSNPEDSDETQKVQRHGQHGGG